MPLFRKKSNANSENRRRRRAQLLLNNSNILRSLELALYHNSNNRYFAKNVIRKVRAKWPKNLVPIFNGNLGNKLKNAYKQIKPELNKRNKNAAAARTAARQARQANERRKANQHAAYLLTNEGKRWKQQNNERIRLQKQQNNEAARRRANANANMFGRTGYSMANFNYY